MNLGNAIQAVGAGYRLGKRLRSGYNKVSRVYKKRRISAFGISRRKPPRAPKPAGTGFNSGYSIVNMKARNLKRRKGRGKKSRKLRYKKKARQANTLAKVAGAMLQKIDKRLYKLNEMELGRGRLLLPNCKDAAYNTFHFLPLHLIDLTHVGISNSGNCNRVLQLVYTAGGVRNTSPATLPQYQFEAGKVFQKDVIDGEAVLTSRYTAGACQDATVIRTGYSTLGSADTMLWYQKDTYLDVVLYGKSAHDTLYSIDVVKLDWNHSEWVHKLSGDANSVLLNGVTFEPSNIDAVKWNELWHGLVAPYTQNPLAQRRGRSGIKVLKSYKFKIPEQSADFDRIPCVKTRIKIPTEGMRRRRRINLPDSVPTNVYNPEDATNLNNQNLPGGANDLEQYEYEDFVHPKARIFLMIRATNNEYRDTTGPGYIGVEKGEDPTYDLKLRTSFVYNSY